MKSLQSVLKLINKKSLSLPQRVTKRRSLSFSESPHTTSKRAFCSLSDRPNELSKFEEFDVEKCFEMERIGDNVFRSTYLRSGSPRSPAVYGGLLFAQALAAAEETVSERLRVHSIHSMFILAAGISKPIDYFVKTLRDGRSFCTRWVEAKQRGHIVFTCQISFHSPEEAAMKHQAKMPEVAPPEHCPELYDGAEQLLEQAAQGHYQINPVREERLRQRIKDKFKVGAPLFEMRPTDLEEFLALKMSPEPNKSFVWVKSVPKLREDDRIHRMMALYNTDSTLTRVALKSHLTQGFIPSQVFSLDHCAWLHHHEFRADKWMLYENFTTIAAEGRAFIEGHLWTREGRLVCTTTQECLVRSRDSKSSL